MAWTLDDVRRFDEDQDADALLEVLAAGDQADWEVRGNAGHALARMGDDRAIPLLIKCLNLLRGDEAARALGEFKDPRAVEPLLKALKNRRFSNQHVVAEALGKIGDPAATDAVTDALNDEHDFIVRSAERALEKIRGTQG